MALNEIFVNADSLDYAVPDTVESGDLVAVGDIIGVAETDAAEGDDGLYYATLRHKGVFAFSLIGAVTAGEAIYAVTADLPDGVDTVQTDSTSATLVGHAVRAKGAGAGTVWVRVNN